MTVLALSAHLPRGLRRAAFSLALSLSLALLATACVPSDNDNGGSSGPDACAFALGTEAAIHVSASCGSADGDGSLAHPYATLAQGIAAAKSGDVIALAVGVYTGGVVLPANVQLAGFEAAHTVVEADTGRVLEVKESGELAISGLALRGKAKVGIWVDKSAVKLSGVKIEGMTGHGVYVQGSPSVELRSCVLRANGGTGLVVKGSGPVAIIDPIYSPVPRAMDNPGGAALGFKPASLIEGNLGGGVAIIDPIYSPKADMAPQWDLTVKASDISGNQGYGVALFGASARVQGSVIRDTHKSTKGAWADGLLITDGTPGSAVGTQRPLSIDAKSVVTGNGRAGVLLMTPALVSIAGEISRNGTAGAWAMGKGAVLKATQDALFFENTRIGLTVSDQAELIVEGARVLGTKEAQIEGSKSVAADGIGIFKGAHARINSAVIEDNKRAGVIVDGAAKVKDGSALDVEIKGCTISGNKYGVVVNGGDASSYGLSNEVSPAAKEPGDNSPAVGGSRKDAPSEDLDVQTELCGEEESCAPKEVD